jgi:hypothetical protein
VGDRGGGGGERACLHSIVVWFGRDEIDSTCCIKTMTHNVCYNPPPYPPTPTAYPHTPHTDMHTFPHTLTLPPMRWHTFLHSLTLAPMRWHTFLHTLTPPPCAGTPSCTPLPSLPCAGTLSCTPLPSPPCAGSGGEIASTFDDGSDVRLGRCDLIEEVMIGDERMVHFSGCALNEACTIVLRGASEWGAGAGFFFSISREGGGGIRRREGDCRGFK